MERCHANIVSSLACSAGVTICMLHVRCCCHAGHKCSPRVPAAVHRPSGSDHGRPHPARVHEPRQHQQHLAAPRVLDTPAAQPRLSAATQRAGNRSGRRHNSKPGSVHLQQQQVGGGALARFQTIGCLRCRWRALTACLCSS